MNKTSRTLLAAFVAVALCVPAISDAAFSSSKLNKRSTGGDSGPQIFSYEDTGVALATLVGANYLANDPQVLEVGDLIYFVGSDGVEFATVATVTGTTGLTVTAMSGTAADTAECIESTVTFDPAATTFGSIEHKDVTATGAAAGDSCVVAAPYDLQNTVANCYVDTTDSAVITLLQPGTILRGSTTWNPSNVDDGDMESKDITVTSAALGDPCDVTFSIDTADLQLTGSVTTAGVCTATLSNSTGAAVDLGSGTVTAAVQDVSASNVDLASGTWNVRTCSAPTP